MTSISTDKSQLIKDLPFVSWLVNSPRTAWTWLVLRVWLGYQWIDVSLYKINNPAWTRTRAALMGFWSNNGI